MVVYWEYAFIENFLLDGLILYLALKIARGKVRVWRLLLASAVGAAEAIVFPLFRVPVWSAYLLKVLGGILLCAVAVSGKRLKTYAVTACAFFAVTFALGGLLTAAYSFFGVEYQQGNGFLVERAPVALVFALAGIFAVVLLQSIKFFYRYGKLRCNLFECTLAHAGREVRWKGLADSGNLLQFRGKPVCVFSSRAAFALFGRNLKEAGRLEIGTVNGRRETPVFICERMKVGKETFENVFLAVGEVTGKEYQLILHTAFLEGKHETVAHAEGLAEKGGRERKRRSLPLRK
jgi:sigma-E processing peptidase SpoIIGA